MQLPDGIVSFFVYQKEEKKNYLRNMFKAHDENESFFFKPLRIYFPCARYQMLMLAMLKRVTGHLKSLGCGE